MQLCQPCPLSTTGTVCESNSKVPKACQAGEIVNGTGCSTCRAGHYCASPGAAELPCPQGTYSRPAATACTPCPLGSQCLTPASLPTRCLAGKYRNEVSQLTCMTCPGGKSCPDPSLAPAPCLSGKLTNVVYLPRYICLFAILIVVIVNRFGSLDCIHTAKGFTSAWMCFCFLYLK